MEINLTFDQVDIGLSRNFTSTNEVIGQLLGVQVVT